MSDDRARIVSSVLDAEIVSGHMIGQGHVDQNGVLVVESQTFHPDQQRGRKVFVWVVHFEDLEASSVRFVCKTMEGALEAIRKEEAADSPGRLDWKPLDMINEESAVIHFTTYDDFGRASSRCYYRLDRLELRA